MPTIPLNPPPCHQWVMLRILEPCCPATTVEIRIATTWEFILPSRFFPSKGAPSGKSLETYSLETNEISHSSGMADLNSCNAATVSPSSHTRPWNEHGCPWDGRRRTASENCEASTSAELEPNLVAVGLGNSRSSAMRLSKFARGSGTADSDHRREPAHRGWGGSEARVASNAA